MILINKIMKKNKYNIFDKVFINTATKIVEVEIKGVLVKKGSISNKEFINFYYLTSPKSDWIPEERLFPSKEELIKSL